MKTRFLIIFGIIGLSILFTPPSFGDHDFCNLSQNMANREGLIKDNIVLIEFLKVLPSAELIGASSSPTTDPAQISMSWSTGVYSFDIQIDGYDVDNPSDCFFPVGYRLNAPHLPEMIGMDFHKDPQIVLDQINELEPKYVKGGPALEPEEPTISDEQLQMMREYCETGIRHPDMMGIPQCIKNEPDCGSGTELVNGICHVIKSDEPTHMEPSIFLDGFMFLIIFSPFFIPGAVIFVVLSKTPRYSREIRIAVCIAAILVLLYFLWALSVGVYPPGYA